MRSQEQQQFIDTLNGYREEFAVGVVQDRLKVIRREIVAWKKKLGISSFTIPYQMYSRKKVLQSWFLVDHFRIEARYYEGLWEKENVMLTRPCGDEFPVTCDFGYDPEYPVNGGWHYGIDYGTPVGTECWFREAGTVVVADDSYPVTHFAGAAPGAWGRYCELQSDRDPAVYWGIAHLSQLNVVEGQHVEAGEVIGLTGGAKDSDGAGTSTGPHLHEQVLTVIAGQVTRVNPNGVVG